MSTHKQSTILAVRHLTDRLFSLEATRDAGFRFLGGQFTMIGLPGETGPIMRAYSMVSPSYAEKLEFLSIKVPDGPLTSRLARVSPGDTLFVGAKASGTLLCGNLLPGRRLFLLATGTGLAPFMSIIREPDTYEAFEQVILVHGCRTAAELAFRQLITEDLPHDEYLGELIRRQLIYRPLVTREPFATMGRITDRLRDGRLFEGLANQSPCQETDRYMICGSPAMLKEIATFLADWGYAEGSSNRPGHYVIERAFVEK